MTGREVGFEWAGRRCVVTGARGFLGTALGGALRRLGAEVHELARPANAPPAAEHVHACDVADTERVRALLGQIRPDTVFHLAAQVTGSRAIDVVLPTLSSNLLGTVNVLLGAAETGCRRVVCLGSLQEPDEAIRAAPPSPYGAAKYAASAYARMFAELYSLPVAIGRPFMAYGAGQLDFSKVVPYLLSKLLRGETADLSSGAQPFDWVYVTDVVDALLAIATANDVAGKTVDIGCGVLTPMRDVATGLARRVGRPDALRFGVLPDRKLEPTRLADVEATHGLVGWRPRLGLDAGLDLTVEWYRRYLA
jgi:nucleoside-diphosphate-sugar epimerase